VNLKEFLKKASESNRTQSRAHLQEPGFSELYVRYNSKRFINNTWVSPILDLASIEVPTHQRCKGLFTKLVKRIRKEYPELHLFVESVLTPRFEKKLEAMGFQNLGGMCPSLYMPPKQRGTK
jgi:hypothetical protein